MNFSIHSRDESQLGAVLGISSGAIAIAHDCFHAFLSDSLASPGLTLVDFLGVTHVAAYERQICILEAMSARSFYVAGWLFVGLAHSLVAILNDWRRGLYILLPGWILFEDLFRANFLHRATTLARFFSPGCGSHRL